MTKQEIAAMIDHTLLSPNVASAKIEQLCYEAKKYGFASVCVNPIFVPLATSQLAGTDIKVCTVIGFPFGAITTEEKISETINAVKDGADEIDMVMNISAAIDGRFNAVGSDIAGVVGAAKTIGKLQKKNIIVKVILETCYFDDETIETCCLCAKKAGADFVKTSTGFANPIGLDGKSLPNGASVHHIELMRKTVGDKMGVKASGGIRSARMALSMIKAGADRIGTSSGVNILDTWEE